MEILVTMGVVVEADSIKDAIAKTEPPNGTVVSLNANPRPQAQQLTGGMQAVRGSNINIAKTPTTTMTQPV